MQFQRSNTVLVFSCLLVAALLSSKALVCGAAATAGGANSQPVGSATQGDGVQQVDVVTAAQESGEHQHTQHHVDPSAAGARDPQANAAHGTSVKGGPALAVDRIASGSLKSTPLSSLLAGWGASGAAIDAGAEACAAKDAEGGNVAAVAAEAPSQPAAGTPVDGASSTAGQPQPAAAAPPQQQQQPAATAQQSAASHAPPPSPSSPVATPAPPPPSRRLINLAALSDGASVLAANPEARKPDKTLDHDMDSFMKNDCSAHKWLAIELSQLGTVESVTLTMRELYSSRVRNFRVKGRQTHPRRDGPDLAASIHSDAWELLGEFAAENKRGAQTFPLGLRRRMRYLLLLFDSHYGNEAMCALNGIEVMGMSVAQELEEALGAADEEEQEAQAAMTGEGAAAAAAAAVAAAAASPAVSPGTSPGAPSSPQAPPAAQAGNGAASSDGGAHQTQDSSAAPDSATAARPSPSDADAGSAGSCAAASKPTPQEPVDGQSGNGQPPAAAASAASQPAPPGPGPAGQPDSINPLNGGSGSGAPPSEDARAPSSTAAHDGASASDASGAQHTSTTGSQAGTQQQEQVSTQAAQEGNVGSGGGKPPAGGAAGGERITGAPVSELGQQSAPAEAAASAAQPLSGQPGQAKPASVPSGASGGAADARTADAAAAGSEEPQAQQGAGVQQAQQQPPPQAEPQQQQPPPQSEQQQQQQQPAAAWPTDSAAAAELAAGLLGGRPSAKPKQAGNLFDVIKSEMLQLKLEASKAAKRADALARRAEELEASVALLSRSNRDLSATLQAVVSSLDEAVRAQVAGLVARDVAPAAEAAAAAACARTAVARQRQFAMALLLGGAALAGAVLGRHPKVVGGFHVRARLLLLFVAGANAVVSIYLLARTLTGPPGQPGGLGTPSAAVLVVPQLAPQRMLGNGTTTVL